MNYTGSMTAMLSVAKRSNEEMRMAAAGSKAAKLRARKASRGRPRKEGAPRHPCGKIVQEWSQRESEKDAQSVVIEARRRIHGINDNVPDEVVKSQLAGSVLGRLFLDKQIDEEQRKAGELYAETMARYYGAVGVPFPSPKAQSLFTIKGHDGEVTDDMAKRARRATNKMMEMERLLLGCESGPQVKSTCFNVCVMDYDHMRHMHQSQVILLRRGLNAIKNAMEK